MSDEKEQPPDAAVEEREPAVRILPAAELFRGEREIRIDLDGVRYRLRITRRNKLILQK